MHWPKVVQLSLTIPRSGRLCAACALQLLTPYFAYKNKNKNNSKRKKEEAVSWVWGCHHLPFMQARHTRDGRQHDCESYWMCCFASVDAFRRCDAASFTCSSAGADSAFRSRSFSLRSCDTTACNSSALRSAATARFWCRGLGWVNMW